jgi:hypothetical protein
MLQSRALKLENVMFRLIVLVTAADLFFCMLALFHRSSFSSPFYLGASQLSLEEIIEGRSKLRSKTTGRWLIQDIRFAGRREAWTMRSVWATLAR